MGRILGLDYGDLRLGFALSDPSCIIATPFRMVECHSDKQAVDAVVELCRETEAEALVVGLPRNMDGSEGPRAEKTHAFCEKLRKHLSIPIELWDERLTTRTAESALIEAGTSRKKRKQLVDKVAAQVILQAYLEARNFDRFGEEADGEGDYL